MIAAGAVLTLAMLSAAPPAAGPRYGDTLASLALTRFHLIKGVRITATAKDGAMIDVSAGSPARGAAAPLRDPMSHTIGTVTSPASQGR